LKPLVYSAEANGLALLEARGALSANVDAVFLLDLFGGVWDTRDSW